MQKCKVCEINNATGPKMVGNIEDNQNPQSIRTLLMCDTCHEKFKNGKISLSIIDNSNDSESTE